MENTHCPRCDEQLTPGQTWCPACGYSLTLGYVMGDDDEEGAAAAQPAGPIWDRVPQWVYLTAAIVILLAAASVGARIWLPERSIPRFYWAAAQFLTGLGLFVVAHFLAYFHAMLDSPDFGPLSFALKPFAIWRHTFERASENWSRITMVSTGATAVLLAVFVVDGIPWGYYVALASPSGPKKKPQVLAAVAKAGGGMGGGGGSASLEGAIDDFTGEVGVEEAVNSQSPDEMFDEIEEGIEGEGEEEAKDNPGEPKDDEEPLKDRLRPWSIDCVVIGYVPLGRSNFGDILVAGVRHGKLRYIGKVSEGITPQMRVKMRTRLKELRTSHPIVDANVPDAHWVEPVMTCRVRFNSWKDGDGNTLFNPAVEKLLSEVQ